MGRRRVIDRDALLDAAEEIVVGKGPASLTFDAVARRAGVSKGGVLYAFPTKEVLVEAMIERRLASFETGTMHRLATGAARSALEARVLATRDESATAAAREASLMVAVAGAGDSARTIRSDYNARFEAFDRSAAGRRARLAFLACEGAFLLRGLGIAEIDEESWQAIFADILELLNETPP